jgi:hypothetical protein
MAETNPADATTNGHPRGCAPTTVKFLFAVLVMQGVLFLSDHYRWFWFGERAGNATLVVTGVLLLLTVAWLLVGRFFSAKPQFSLAALMLMTAVATIPSLWLARAQWEVRQQEAYRQRGLSQRDAIDELILDEMKQRGFKSSKLAYVQQQGRDSVLDFLIGKDVALYPQLRGCGNTVNDRRAARVVREWMMETGSEKEYLGFSTDIWDFGTADVPFMDTLLIAIHDGKVVAYRFIADAAY